MAPRTGVGRKGFLEGPDLDDSGGARRGRMKARSLLSEFVGLGLPCGTEILEPIRADPLSDLLCRNRADGSIEIAGHALRSVRRTQRCFGVLETGGAGQIHTAGNSDAHVVLRGGAGRENYFSAYVATPACYLDDPSSRAES